MRHIFSGDRTVGAATIVADGGRSIVTRLAGCAGPRARREMYLDSCMMSSIPLRGNHHQAPSRPSFSTSLSLNVRSTSHETPCRDGRPRAPRPWADDRERQRAAWRTLTTSTQPPALARGHTVYTHSVRDHHYETTRVASVPLAAIRWRPRGEDGEMAGAGGVRAHAAREHTNEQRNTQQQFGSLALLWRSPHTHRMSVMTGWQACPCARTRHAHRGKRNASACSFRHQRPASVPI